MEVKLLMGVISLNGSLKMVMMKRMQLFWGKGRRFIF